MAGGVRGRKLVPAHPVWSNSIAVVIAIAIAIAVAMADRAVQARRAARIERAHPIVLEGKRRDMALEHITREHRHNAACRWVCLYIALPMRFGP